MSEAHSRISSILLTVGQVALLSLIWMAAQYVSLHYLPQLPGGVLGMLVLLALFASGKVSPTWFERGAGWLLAELLLFFIPAVIAIVNFGALFADAGARIVLVIVLSTALVMLSTAFAVEWTGRLIRLRRRRMRLAALEV